MPDQDRKFLFDVNIFDAPPKQEPVEDLPPPPPVFSEEEMAVAKEMAFEQGRQQGERDQRTAREQAVAASLEQIAQSFSQLFAAETVRESIFEKEALTLTIHALDTLFPSLTERLGHGEARAVIEKTLIAHRKTKEITIHVSPGMKGEIEALISRIRRQEHDDVLWRVVEIERLTAGDCSLEWSDGGAIRDSVRAARDIRRSLEAALGKQVAPAGDIGDSEDASFDILSIGRQESPVPVEKSDE